MSSPTCFCGRPASGLGEPSVSVETAGGMDPAALGYALDQLRHLVTHFPRPVDSVRLTLRAPERPERVVAEATIAAGDRVVRARETAGAARGAVDRILRHLASPAARSVFA